MFHTIVDVALILYGAAGLIVSTLFCYSYSMLPEMRSQGYGTMLLGATWAALFWWLVLYKFVVAVRGDIENA